MSKFVSRLLLSSALAFAMAPVAQAQTPPPEAEGADTDEGGSDIVVAMFMPMISIITNLGQASGA